ncbi:uroporphyrinogen-III C-methyltransferase [Chryseolinea lacunae]|uniref:uroporphyrinogen-III C-methyltransferase n=1 Tax=Chryseolinea lacunae TaxID=2801331 RepID=A0ABS1KT45_9BACT|nr:uroporphyrinogen-III C-methyltransferase [Chryseolinea lacunae]MBL0742653.1 uroporphyrinogen-III C-methyltransferase [Chryseolinea lacunae]
MIPTVLTFGKPPRVTLVGAGPGDPELLTLKGLMALKAADVVLFDALVSEEILSLIPVGVPAFSVGKRAGAHSHSQDEINEMIVEYAYAFGHVVRLKGGDPFVFGRGAEEVAFAELHGVTTAVVPGISSALAVPASVNVPVTERGVSESFWVVTGTTKSGDLSNDIALAAQSSATVVILMGLNKIESIMQLFAQHGKSETPVAVVQNGTLPSQSMVTGKVNDIVAKVAAVGIGSPAIMIVGEVVRHARALTDLTQEVVTQYQ